MNSEPTITDVYAGIVSYEPDIERLSQNISAIRNQVDAVVVFDNGSLCYDSILKILPSDVTVIKYEKNEGIAYALNRLIEWGCEKGYKWMISFDQDSVCDPDYVANMLPYLSVEESIGIVAPVIEDRNIGIVGHNPVTAYAAVRTCITSGAFNNTDAWKEIGGYDEYMFIDSVDFEYCYRLWKNGYKVIQVRDVHLLHELGASVKRRFLFWDVDVYNHSAFRKYYISRNNIYYPLKHRLIVHLFKGLVSNLWLMVVVVLYETEKSNKLSAIIKGTKDGFKKVNR